MEFQNMIQVIAMRLRKITKLQKAYALLVVLVVQTMVLCYHISSLPQTPQTTDRIAKNSGKVLRELGQLAHEGRVNEAEKTDGLSVLHILTICNQSLSKVCNKSNTVHPWSQDLMINYNITCGLDTIQCMARNSLTGTYTTRESLVSLDNIVSQVKEMYQIYEAPKLRNETIQRYKQALEDLKSNWANRAILVAKKIDGVLQNNDNLQGLRQAFVKVLPQQWINQTSLLNRSELDLTNHAADMQKVKLTTYRTRKDPSLIPQSLANPKAKSIAFVKPYKVGGTVVASLLTMSAYLYNLEIGTSTQWLEQSLFKNEQTTYCADIVGTGHPISGFYENLHATASQQHNTFFCRERVEFMMIRDPIDRLWSGYQHSRCYNRTLSLQEHLGESKTALVEVSEPPHVKLSQNVSKALELSDRLLTLISDSGETMDKSLMLLSLKANMSVCDFMYEPCSANQAWSTSKCNHKTTEISSSDMELLKYQATKSGEKLFYDVILKRFQKMIINNTRLDERLASYRQIRTKALEVCTRESPGYKYAEIFLTLDPRVRQVAEVLTKRWVLKGENLHSIDPRWLCMQWYCHNNFPIFP